MATTRKNPRYLEDLTLPAAVQPVDALESALSGSDCLVVAVPSHGMRAILERVAAARRGAPSEVPTDLLIASKGIEPGTLKSMFEVAMDCFEGSPDVHVNVLGGPSFAREVALEMATVVVIGSPRASSAARLQRQLSTEAFRVYVTQDVVGVELGGALKNVICDVITEAEDDGDLGLPERKPSFDMASLNVEPGTTSSSWKYDVEGMALVCRVTLKIDAVQLQRRHGMTPIEFATRVRELHENPPALDDFDDFLLE